MEYDNVCRWISFQIRKIIMKTIYSNRFTCGSRGKVGSTTELRLMGNQSEIHIGDRINIRPASDLFAFKSGKLFLGNDVFVNRGVVIGAAESITIGDNVTIGPNTCIYDHDHSMENIGEFIAAPIVIEQGVWIGANVTILKGCHIGSNAVVAAGSVVTKDIPSNSVTYNYRDTRIVKRY